MNEYTLEEKNKINECLQSITKRMEEKPYESISMIHKNLSSVMQDISLGHEILESLDHTSQQVLDLDQDLHKTLTNIKNEVGGRND